MTTTPHQSVPSLRFRDNEGKDYPDWEQKRLGEIANFSKGKGISKSDIVSDGAVKCIRYGELYTHYGTTITHVVSSTDISSSQLKLSSKNDVIIPSSGETAFDIATVACLRVDGVALGGDINIIRCQQNGVFLAYYLNYKKPHIARLAQGISVVHLYASQLRLLKLSIPSIKEQQKIAAFLSAIDTRIEQLNRKKTQLEQYKQGMMQKLFSREIRFRCDKGKDYPDWNEVRLGRVFSERSERAGNTKQEMLSVTLSNGVVKAKDLDRHDNSPADKSKYKKLNVNDIAYNSMRMWQGASGVSRFNGIVSPAYTVLIPKGNQHSQFWGYYFKLNSVLQIFQKELAGNDI